VALDFDWAFPGGAMGATTMGRVVVTALIENLEDKYKVEQGAIGPDQARKLEVTDALVDTGATMLSMPARMIRQLGLRPLRIRQARTSGGPVSVQVYGTVRLTIQGRDCPSDVTEVPDDCPVLIGQVPLELLDFVVDSSGQKLIGNPDHGGEHIIELYLLTRASSPRNSPAYPAPRPLSELTCGRAR
jgi:predicted aspartyl protease